MTSASETPPDPPTKAGPRPPLLRAGGCLLVLIVALFFGGMIALWMVVSGGIQQAPLTFPELAATDLDRAAISSWRQTPSDLRYTPTQWNLILSSIIEKQVAAGELQEGSGVYIEPQPDGPLRVLISVGFPDSTDEVPWLLRGRFVNLEMIGTVKIHDGSIEEAKLDLYQMGSIFKGHEMPREQSIETLQKLQLDLASKVGWLIDPIHFLEYDGEFLHIVTDELKEK